jgi:hypothetical protein
MKKLLITTLLTSLTCLSNVTFAEDTLTNSVFQDHPLLPSKIVNVLDIPKYMQEEISTKLDSPFVIEFSENTVIPLNFFLTGDLVQLVYKDNQPAQLHVKETFYVMCRMNHEGEPLLFSSDLVEWKSLLDFLTGKASIECDTVDGQSTCRLGAEVYRRS